MTIDLPRARELLKQAVETQGRDFVYNPDGILDGSGCHYTPRPDVYAAYHPKSRTGCLVGVALDLAGETKHLSSAPVAIRQLDTVHMAREAREYFAIAQTKQDYGSTWGEAYDFAEAWANA